LEKKLSLEFKMPELPKRDDDSFKTDSDMKDYEDEDLFTKDDIFKGKTDE
jgi:hypothetical protein